MTEAPLRWKMGEKVIKREVKYKNRNQKIFKNIKTAKITET